MRVKIKINKHLYRDGIRQLKTIGILGMVIFCLAGFLTAIGLLVTNSYYNEQVRMGADTATAVNLYQCHWILFTAIFILAPVMTMMLFNFLNHRNASDFYHGIPDTRATLYVSYVAAILTWLVGIIVVSTAVCVISMGLVPGYYVVLSGIPKALFLIISACVLVMGGFLIAKGLTGTGMSNLLAAVLILFAPRLFVTAIEAMLESMMDFVAWEYSAALFNGRYNIPAGLFLVIFTGANPLGYWSSGLYTLALGLIYVILGGLVFCCRRSESAGQAAVSRSCQTVFRLALTMIICLVPVFFIVNDIVDTGIWYSEEAFLVVVFYVIAVVVWFIYELVTTGKLKHFGRLCRDLLILAGLNVALIAGILAIYQITIHKCPSADKIDYVVMIEDENYFQREISQIKLTDKEAIEATAAALERTVSTYVHPNLVQNEVTIGETLTVTEQAPGTSQSWVTKTVAIHTGIETLYRNVRYSSEEWETIVDCLSLRSEYRESFYRLPELDGEYVYIYGYNGWLSSGQAAKVYEIMRDEVRQVDFSEWYLGVTGGNRSTYLDMLILSSETEDWPSQRYSAALPILKSMPRTAKCYFDQINSMFPDEKTVELWQAFEQTLTDSQESETPTGISNGCFNLSLSLYDENWNKQSTEEYYLDCWMEGDRLVTSQWNNEIDEEVSAAIGKFLLNATEGEYRSDDLDGSLVIVEIYGYAEIGMEYFDINRIAAFFLKDEIPEEISVLLKLSDQ